MPHRRSLPTLALAAALAAPGCATPPPAERTVYIFPEVPMVLASQPAGPAVVAAPRVVLDDPESEAARRAWIEQEYYRPRVQGDDGTAGDGRYIPEKQREPERVIVVDHEPSRPWLPPISLSLGYWGGHGGHHDDGWGWGVGTAFPLWYW